MARPFPQSLCHHCQHRRLVAGSRSTFILCVILPQKYPPQPVATCAAFARRDEDASGDGVPAAGASRAERTPEEPDGQA